jgi:hypothetical protein
MGQEVLHATFGVSIQNHPKVLKICKRFKCENALDVKEALRALRYKVNISDDRIHITEIVHKFTILGDEERLWQRLAPYTSDGDIVWYGEDGETWTYVFHNGVMTVVDNSHPDSYLKEYFWKNSMTLSQH